MGIRSSTKAPARADASTNRPTNQPDRQRAVALVPALVAAGRFAAVVCGPPGLAGALSAVRDGGRRRGRGVFPVRREVTLA